MDVGPAWFLKDAGPGSGGDNVKEDDIMTS